MKTVDPLADLPSDVRAAVDRFTNARARVLTAMLNTPLLAHQTAEREQLIEDLNTVGHFVAAMDAEHARRGRA
jgi:ABC-type protease/lipase transport system fused ATPase/permease subunit